MRSRIRIFVVAMVALLSVATAIFFVEREPRYQGRSLNSWLLELNYHVANENRAPACEAIRIIGTNALPYLLKEMRKKDSAARRKVMEWSERLSARFNFDVFHWTPADGYRSGATQAIGVLGPRAAPAIPELVCNLSDPELAGDSALALSLIGESALPAIIKSANSSEWCVRWSAAFALEQFTNPPDEAVETLLSLATDPQVEVRQSAAESLGNLRPQTERSVLILASLLSDTNGDVRISACRSLAAFGASATPATLALSNALADSSLRVEAAGVLKKIGLPALPTLLGLLSHPDAKVRVEAIGLVSGLRRHGTNCVAALLPMLRDADAKVRERAVNVIGSFRAAATNYVSELLLLLHDPDPKVRFRTIFALRIIPTDPKPYIPLLVEALKQEQDRSVRESILVAFEQFGEDAKVAVPALVEMVRAQTSEDRFPMLIYLAAVDPDSARSLGAEALLLEIARTNAERLRAVFRPTTNVVPVMPIPKPVIPAPNP